jgi:hypothetical protein
MWGCHSDSSFFGVLVPEPVFWPLRHPATKVFRKAYSDCYAHYMTTTMNGSPRFRMCNLHEMKSSVWDFHVRTLPCKLRSPSQNHPPENRPLSKQHVLSEGTPVHLSPLCARVEEVCTPHPQATTSSGPSNSENQARIWCALLLYPGRKPNAPKRR